MRATVVFGAPLSHMCLRVQIGYQMNGLESVLLIVAVFETLNRPATFVAESGYKSMWLCSLGRSSLLRRWFLPCIAVCFREPPRKS